MESFVFPGKYSQNEALLGQDLADLNMARDNFFIATKVNEANQGYEATIASVKESLKKLRMDYVDLLMVHWPIHIHFFCDLAGL